MKFNFEMTEPTTTHKNNDDTDSSEPSLKSANTVQWVTLQDHPVFSTTTTTITDGGGPRNLVAWDGATRLYYWDSFKRCLHRISIRLGELEPSSILASSPSKVLIADAQIDFAVNKISINRNGSILLLAGSEGLFVMYLYGRTCSKDDTIICKTVPVGGRIYFHDNDGIRVLQASWHPYSDAHLGILSSDSVFRLFYLSSDVLEPEQEYYLQPLAPGSSRNAAAICPVDFSFGRDHLWERFTVFVLFGDGSIYILCPVVPFGSVYSLESILEVYSDAQTFGLKSSNLAAVRNSHMAICWLESAFPELSHEAEGEESLSAARACSFALFDASLCLQGPLRRIGHSREAEGLAVQSAECEGHAVSLLYNLVTKDTILATAWSGGQLQIDALADEIQPVWNVGNPPRLRSNSYGLILSLAMICDSVSSDLPMVEVDRSTGHNVWLGHPPALLRLAVVDLALPRKTNGDSHIMMFSDPLMLERIYSLHDGGVDSIVLHFLPFASQSRGKDETAKAPSLHPVLNIFQGGNPSISSLYGFASLSDSFGHSWIVGVTSTQECIVMEMKSWDLLLPLHADTEKLKADSEEQEESNILDMISKTLLSGPPAVRLPHSSSLSAVAANSIEGRSALHYYIALFHENYVEYAHKVFVELKHHAPHVKRIIDDEKARLGDAQDKLLKVDKKQSVLDKRIDRTIHMHNTLEQRLQRLRDLPGVHKKHLSRAESKFKSELDEFTGVQLDALHSSMDTLRARLRRLSRSSNGDPLNQQKQLVGKNYVQDAEISQLQSLISKLLLVNTENSSKVRLLESTLKSRESNRYGTSSVK